MVTTWIDFLYNEILMSCLQDSTRFDKTMALIKKYDPDEQVKPSAPAAAPGKVLVKIDSVPCKHYKFHLVWE